MTDSSCSGESLAAGEPMGGSAPTASRILIVEQPGSWPAIAIESRSLSDSFRAELAAIASQAETKVFLARRGDRKKLDGSRNVWTMVRNGPHVQYHHIIVPEETSLSSLVSTFTQQSRSASEADGPAITPVIFVCTNGARDRCCAVKGRKLLRTLDPGFWEISHLGGHRFAPTALRFPDGVLFGRLDESSATTIAAMGMPELAQVRGRIGRAAWLQVAELAIAKELGIPLAELDSRGEPDNAIVNAGTAQSWHVAVSRNPILQHRASCTKTPSTDAIWTSESMDAFTQVADPQ